MAERDTDQQHTADAPVCHITQKEMVHLQKDDGKQDGADTITQQQTEASSSASTDREINSENGDDAEQPNIKNSNSAEESVASLTEGSSPPADDTVGTVKENSATLEAEEGSHGDYTRDVPRHEQPRVSGEDHAGERKAPTSPPPVGDGDNDHVDGPDTEALGTTSGPGDNVGSSQEEQENEQRENTTFQQTDENIELVENIGPVTQETAEAEPPGPVVTANKGGATIYLLLGVLGVVLALLGQHFLLNKSPPQKQDLRQIDIFLGELEKVKTQFPNQRAELWTRSRIHLLRHLQTAQPSEPVSLILTAGRGGERTLHCLAQRLASAFSSSLNASVLHIDGTGKSSQDSDQVKLDIDSQLQGAFEGDKPVAVINRFDELPPGSTLIFYRYCDHENAAYKKTCLIFTVLLGEEEEIPAETRLSTVEEMVDDHLQKKFLSHGHPVSFDRMDLDKYGGLWSRISHLILPVAAEGRLEHDGC